MTKMRGGDNRSYVKMSLNLNTLKLDSRTQAMFMCPLFFYILKETCMDILANLKLSGWCKMYYILSY